MGLALAAVVGISVADAWKLPVAVLAGLVALLAIVCVRWPRTMTCWLLTGVGFATIHTLRYQCDPARELEAELLSIPRVVTATGVVATEPEPLSYRSSRKAGRFTLEVSELAASGKPVALETQLIVTWAGPLPQYGDRVRVHGSLQALERPRNPGQFDYAEYLRRQGVFGRLEAVNARDCTIEAHDAGNAMVALSLKLRAWMQTTLALDLEDSPELSSLIASMVLGMRGDTPDDVKDLFRKTGTLHLFAVSGLNVAMLGVIAWQVLKPFGMRRSSAVFVIIPMLFFYAMITGLGASCLRAAVMASIVLLGESLDRRTSVLNSLAAAALVILAWDTNQYFSPGFRFSFALVLVIVLLANRIQWQLEWIGKPDAYLPRVLWNWRQRLGFLGWQAIAGAIGVTIAAWCGSLLFTAGYFHLFSLSAIGANLISVPLAFLILALGVITLITAPVVKFLAVIFSNANWACAKFLLVVVRFFAATPGGYQYVETPHSLSPPAAEMTVLDVGEGAAIHLRSRGDDWLIDGGSSQRYERITLPYLRSRGVNRLDALVLTHGDTQHLGGIRAALDDLAPRMILDSPLKDRSSIRRRFHAELATRAMGKAIVQRGDVLQCGGATVRVLYPAAGMVRSVADDKALVLCVECDGIRALLTSDSGFTTEMWLLEHEPDLRADLLIKGHHAKDISGLPQFVARVHPQAVIVGQQRFGVLPETLDPWVSELEATGVSVFRQDQCGAVSVRIRDGSFELRGFLNGQTRQFRK
jgi:ComEC/Rec2-related protein